jgi:adhesin/invasin
MIVGDKMLYRWFSYYFTIIVLVIELTGCLGGGGGDSSSDLTTTTEITDARVAKVALLVTDNFQSADGESFILLTVIARDRANNPLAGVDVSLTSASDFAVIVTPKGVTGENGRFTTGVVSSVAETFQIMATAGGVQSELAEVTFLAPTGLIELVATEAALATNETTTVTITLYNEATRAPLPNAPFTVTVSGAAKLDNVPTATDSKGQASFTVIDGTAETVTVTVTSGSISQSLSLYFGATLSLLPTSSNAIDSTILTALLKDATDTPIVGQQVSFNFIGSNDATLTPTLAITGEDGTAAVKVIDLTQVGGNVIVRVTSGNLMAQATVRFGEQLVDPQVRTIKLIVINNLQRADGSSTITLSVMVRDNQEVPLAGIPVKLISDSDSAVFTTLNGLTGADGRFTTTVTSQIAQTFTVTPIAGGKQGEAVLVTFIAPTSSIQLTAAKPVLAINETTTVTITLYNESNQAPLPNASFTVTVSGAAKLDNIPKATDSNGQASFIVTDSIAETVTVTVISGSLSQELPLYFGATLSLLPISSNAIDNTTLTALLKDATDTPIVGQQVNFNFIGSNNATLTPTLAITGEDGTAAVKVIDLTQVGGNVIVKVTSGNLIAQATVRFGEQLVDPRVHTVKLIVINDLQRADGSSTITLSVMVRDNQEVPLAGIPVKLISDSDSAVFTTLNGLTEADGHFTTTVTSQIAQTFTVTPIAGGKQGEAEPVTFIASTSFIQLIAAEPVLPVRKTTTVTVMLYYEPSGQVQPEPLPNATFKVNVSGRAILGNFLPNPNITNGQLKTNADGQASFTVTDDTSEQVIVTVISGVKTQTLLLYFGANLELLPQTVNTIDEAKLKAVLKDGQNTPLINQEVTFSFVNSNNETLSPTIATTGEDGTVEVTVTDLAKNGGLAVIKAKSGLLSAEATVQFKANFGGNRQLVATTTATVLNLGQSATITAYITDDNNLPIAGQTVNFSVTTTNGTFAHAQLSTLSGISDENGEVKTTILSTVGENVLVTVQADTAEQEISLYFGAQFTLLPTQAEGIADGKTAITLTTVLKDAIGVGIQNIPVTLRMPVGQALLTDFHPHTDELGRAQIQVSSIYPEQVTIEAQVDTLVPVATTYLTFQPSQPSQIILSSSTGVDISLSLNGKAIITAEINDSQGNPVKDGTQVSFTTTGGGEITELALTKNGKAQANFSATNQAGLVTITATAGTVTESITLTVEAGSAGVIEISKIEPKVIGIIGSGVAQIATIEFLVKDNLGNPVVDGTEVNFSLGNTILSGSETITTQGQSGESAVGTTNNGLVKVALKSGRVAGTIDVVATVNKTISTVASVTIVGGEPDAKHLSLAAEYLNVAGGVTLGLLDKITAYVGDRFGNIVPDNTPVNFISEGGTIGNSIGGGAFTTTTQLGQATAILQTAEPNVPRLGGVPTFRDRGHQCNYDYSFTDSANIPLCGNPGLVTIVAFTTGTESFTDTNGNGQYDAGEAYEDLSEPYIDGNDNSLFDPGELYIDVNNNGQFDEGNDQFDGPGGQFSNTTIWKSTKVLFSTYTEDFQIEPPPPPTILADSFSIPDGEGQIFVIKNFKDIYGNALVAGSRLIVTSTGGILGGNTNSLFEDINERVEDPIEFTLSSSPAQLTTTTDAEGKTTTEFKYPEESTVTIKIEISSPFKDEAPGGNGSKSKIISGKINVKPSPEK